MVIISHILLTTYHQHPRIQNQCPLSLALIADIRNASHPSARVERSLLSLTTALYFLGMHALFNDEMKIRAGHVPP